MGTSSKMIEPVDIMPQISCVIVPIEFNPLFFSTLFEKSDCDCMNFYDDDEEMNTL